MISYIWKSHRRPAGAPRDLFYSDHSSTGGAHLIFVSRIYSVWQTRAKSKDTTIIPFTQDTLLRSHSDLPGFYELKLDTVNGTVLKWLGKKVQHYINHDSFRDMDNYMEEKPDDMFCIAVMGDSFPYGLFVADNETHAEQLKYMLRGSSVCTLPKMIEVINFGAPGHDAEMSAYRYNFRIKNYVPNLVLRYHIENYFIEYASFVQDLWLHIKKC